MKKYLVLYHSSVSAMEQMAKATPEQAKAGMAMWMTWGEKNKAAIVDMGTPVANAQTFKASGGSPSKSTVGGFSILQAQFPAALKKALDNHPHLMMPGNTIEVHEFLPLPGM